MSPVSNGGSGPQPYYADEHVTLFHGDSRELLPVISADLAVTDPPYGIGLDYGHADDWRPDRDFWRALYDALPRSSSLHMTCSNRHLPYWIEELDASGFNYLHTSVYWNDTRAGGNWNGQFAYAWEPLLSFGKGHGFKLAERMLTDVLQHGGKRVTEHPAERTHGVWLAFMRLLPAGVILDPFAGSGTTLRVAKDLGRRAIGIEIEEKFCELAANRCAQEVMAVA